ANLGSIIKKDPMRWLTTLLMRVLPWSWRASVEAELEQERRAGGHAQAWLAWQTARIGVPLRFALTGHAFGSEVRYALRSLRQTPWFTAGAALTFAIGIGVNAAVFSMLDQLLFRPMPYARPAELTVIWPIASDGRLYMRTPKPLALAAKRAPGLFAGMASAG